VRGVLAVLAAVAIAGVARAQDVAITVDDLPAHSALPPGVTRVDVARDVLAALKAARVRSVTGFINGVQLAREPQSAPVLQMWRDAGYPLANHTWTHLDLRRVGPEAFEADIARNEALLRGQAKWLRYPFLVEGDTSEARAHVRGWLKDHGYRVASVTLSFEDWAFNEPYARCLAKDDTATATQLEARYLSWAQASLAYEQALSRQLYGREVPLVLLMHLGAMDAKMLPRLLAQYRAAGVRFVSLQQAMADPVYAADREMLPADSPTTLEAEALRRGLPIPPKSWDLRMLDVCR
jgi:peptidoglycan/xylan/chitin deacetylase (PgdA/CDA1 family)